MSDPQHPYGDAGIRFLVAAACLVVVVAGLRAAAELVLPFLVAVFLAVVSAPLMGWLQRWHVPRPLAALCTILAAVGVVGVFGLIVGGSVN